MQIMCKEALIKFLNLFESSDFYLNSNTLLRKPFNFTAPHQITLSKGHDKNEPNSS